MPLIIRGEGQEFQPAPPGLHQAVCCDAVDTGWQETPWGKKHKIKLVWQIASRNEKGERFQVRATYTASLHEKARLRHDLESWRGRPFTKEELAEFDVEKLIGANCQLQLTHRVSSNDRTYANVQAIVPLAKGMPKMEVENYEREPWADQEDIIEGEIASDPPADYDDDTVPF